MNRWVYNFTFGYKENILFFDNVSIDFFSDKINVIIGKNGIGKSTLFNVLQGKIFKNNYINGFININSRKQELKDQKVLSSLYFKVHLVAQDFKEMLALDFTVIDNIKMASINKIPSFGFVYKKLLYTNLLEEIGVDLNKKVSELSGGQQQLLSIIMSLQKEISVLLLDEPTSALDDFNSELLMIFLKKLSLEYNIIVVLILHDTELINRHRNSIYLNEIYKIDENRRDIRKIE